jgi:GGDEF domain-containing protein
MSSKSNATAAIDENLLPVFGILLRGMVSAAIKGDAEQYLQFRTKMQKVADLDAAGTSVRELAIKAEAAVSLVHHHSIRTSEYFGAQISEWRAIMELLVSTLVDLAVARPDDARRLREISQQIYAASGEADLREGKLDMTKCIAEIRQVAERGIVKQPEAGAHDPVTDLPGRSAAEAALVEACGLKDPGCTVLLLLDRLKLYNQRYGREVGDKTLRFFSDFVRHSMECQTSLYRWSGPALLLICAGPADKVQPEMRKILEPRLHFECESGSRHLLLSVDAIWNVLPLMVDPRLLINKIDAFSSA